MSVTDFASDERVVWPENWQAYEVFRWMDTQWLMTMGHRYGLNYQTLALKLDRMRLTEDERDALEFDVRMMEDAALEQISEDTEMDK